MTDSSLEGELMTLLMVLGMVIAAALVFEAPVLGPWIKKQIGKVL